MGQGRRFERYWATIWLLLGGGGGLEVFFLFSATWSSLFICLFYKAFCSFYPGPGYFSQQYQVLDFFFSRKICSSLTKIKWLLPQLYDSNFFHHAFEKEHKLMEIVLTAQEKSLFNLLLISRKKESRKKERFKNERNIPIINYKPFLFFFLILITSGLNGTKIKFCDASYKK